MPPLSGSWTRTAATTAPVPGLCARGRVVVHDSGEWLLTSGTVVRPSRSFSVRCSCGHETSKHESEAIAVEMFKAFHGDEPGLKVVPVVRA